jgi:hypothetical protein
LFLALRIEARGNNLMIWKLFRLRARGKSEKRRIYGLGSRRLSSIRSRSANFSPLLAVREDGALVSHQFLYLIARQTNGSPLTSRPSCAVNLLTEFYFPRPRKGFEFQDISPHEATGDPKSAISKPRSEPERGEDKSDSIKAMFKSAARFTIATQCTGHKTRREEEAENARAEAEKKNPRRV